MSSSKIASNRAFRAQNLQQTNLSKGERLAGKLKAISKNISNYIGKAREAKAPKWKVKIERIKAPKVALTPEDQRVKDIKNTFGFTPR